MPVGGGAAFPPAVPPAVPVGAAGAGAGAPNAPATAASGAAVDPAVAVAEPPALVLAVEVWVADMATAHQRLYYGTTVVFVPNHMPSSTFFIGTGGSGITSGFGARSLPAVDCSL